MQLELKDPHGNDWHEGALHVLGASTISYPDPGAGPVVDPPVDLGGYDAATASYVPPIACTKRQFLLELLGRGKTEADVLAALEDAPEAMIEWHYPDAGVFHRQHALFAELSRDFSWTAAKMNEAFVAAAGR